MLRPSSPCAAPRAASDECRLLTSSLPGSRLLQGFGWAIAKCLAEAGAEISLGVWVPALNIFGGLTRSDLDGPSMFDQGTAAIRDSACFRVHAALHEPRRLAGGRRGPGRHGSSGSRAPSWQPRLA